MDTVQLTLTLPSAEHDRYVAWLEDVATGFLQEDAALRAYVSADDWTPELRERLTARLAADGYPTRLTVDRVADMNWNAVWEESLTPVRAGPYLVCPTPADVPPEHGERTVLLINPQMSFGTGHHATTRLALALLAEAVKPGDRVLDVGTGTGVLAIAACRSGARSAVAVDTNPDAVRNARENALRNEVRDAVSVREGSIEVVPDDHYDFVVANITKAILLELLPALEARRAPDGGLLLSGLLDSDRASVIEAAAEQGLHPDTTAREDGWWAARFVASE